MAKPQTEFWHHQSTEDVVSRLEADIDRGLGLLEIDRRLDRHGPNSLTQRVGETPLQILFRQFQQPLVYILLAAVALTLVLREWADAAVIFAVVIVNATIGFMQEAKALKAIDALSKIMNNEATVVRGGQPSQVAAAELVPGDLVLLQSGDRVPADLRLVRVKDLQIDESALTGESVPVEKHTDILAASTVLADRTNMVFSTTLVTYGTAAGLVVATGDRTEIGQINELIASADVLETPLVRRINELSHSLLKVILVLASLVAIAIMIRGESAVEVLLAAVALSVGAIPEGLPAVVTATLALGVSRLAQRHAIVRKLPAVETLGSTTVICSDKTGTLTQNQMTVCSIYTGGQQYGVTGTGYDPDGHMTSTLRDGDEATKVPVVVGEPLSEILLGGLLCNDARVTQDDDDNWRVEGDPTEAALLVSAAKGGFVRDHEQTLRPRLDVVPFESQHQYMATLHRSGGETTVYMKGSVEQLLPRCVSLFGGGDLDVDETTVMVQTMAKQGLRVLALATKPMPSHQETLSHDDVQDGLQLLGLQGMIDPPRPEAITAVKACQQAGIKVKMITGDHVGTATAIASQLGLEGQRDEHTQSLVGFTGLELEQMTDRQLIESAENAAVFARVSPSQKLRLVEALQSRDHVVAMTGDGVNDAPALRQANIGVAMGITGTEVTKEAADMILTDDNFASIEAAVEEGRGIYDNLIKFIAWTLPTNLGEAGIILVAAFLGLQLPITPLQILWINMATAVLLGATLAFEPKEPNLMSRPPRAQNDPILSRTMIWRTLWVGGILVVATYMVFAFKKSLGVDVDSARTAAVNVIVLGQVFYLLSCRSLRHSMFRVGVFSNRWLWLGVVGMIALQLLFTYSPLMNRLFESAPTTWRPWALAIGSGLLLYMLVELDKWRFGQSRVD
ncbi:putative cation-transporting ATPase F [Planctomycetes bacterium CA13]|uniref:Putative cation-transporting ATPase F n=1 Tax=Novipirellula herctigrandis TaxID=2527986 RepID=A0A5C5Z9M7_9BACT|nr:putative cation-transporting ATPase F [Planctomycetes bacterium CA13]